MPVQPGTKLGPYEIVAPIGAGGMGEVYRAADTRLNRTVAIKVLPPQFSENAEMKQRFEREAQTIAALNHPHICTLYDVGRQDGVEFLVMEYLQGETLAQRLARGPLPLEEALKVAVQIADALDKAHGQGVTHRDLKPGNVMLTDSGAKLLDFGLAKVRQQSQPPGAASRSPVSADTTVPGAILGTMQYMAPEQLEGKDADARTDIFAFGALLYEMVSGARAFDGRSQALLIASIMSAHPEPLSKLQPAAPQALDYVITRCLAKDPDERLQTAWDLVCQLQWIAEGRADSGLAAPIAAKYRRRGLVAKAILAAAALLIALMAMPAIRYYRGADQPESTRFLVSVPDMPIPEAIGISPDGKTIAYSARDASTTSLFVRPINVETPTKLAGTEGAGRLFWSPDSRSIAFFAGGKLKKIEAAGGPPQNICETPDLDGGAWNQEGVIVFASSKGLQRVLAEGGEPELIGEPSKEGGSHHPYFLPDGRHYLYLSSSDKAEEHAIYAGSIDSKETSRLIAAESNAIYAEPGYLLYHREGTLYAQAFNANRMKLSGEAVRIADKVPYGATGAAAFAASQTGVLILRNNPPILASSAGASVPAVVSAPLLWLDRSGKKTEQAGGIAGWAGVDVSPDGKRIAAHRHDPEGGDVWIFDAGNATPSKFTFDAAQDNAAPVWTPDGKRIAFASRRNGKWEIFWKPADNTQNEELLLESEIPVAPMSWSPDGRFLVYWTNSAKTSGDIWALPVAGDRKPVVILETGADERHPQVSPDGKWIAYSSNESGRSEIYVKSFPEGPAKIQVSVNGGLFPRWKRDGRELYFMSLVSLGNMMASEIRTTGSSVQREAPRVLFQSTYVNSVHAGQYAPYAISSDGQRFLMTMYETLPALYASGVVGRGPIATVSTILPSVVADRHAQTSSVAGSVAPINVILNWTSLLNR